MGQNEEITDFAGKETYTLCILLILVLSWHLDLHVADVGSSHVRECLASAIWMHWPLAIWIGYLLGL